MGGCVMQGCPWLAWNKGWRGQGSPASAAADGVHDFNPVFGLQPGLGVLTAQHDVVVQFHRNPPVMQPELLHQVSDRVASRQAERLAIQNNLYIHSALESDTSGPVCRRRHSRLPAA